MDNQAEQTEQSSDKQTIEPQQPITEDNSIQVRITPASVSLTPSVSTTVPDNTQTTPEQTPETSPIVAEPIVESPVVTTPDSAAVSEILATPEPASVTAQTPHVKHHNRLFLIIFLCVALLLGLAVWLLGPKIADKYMSKPVPVTITKTTKKVIIKTPADVNAELAKFITPTTGETWLATPKAMTAQGWLKSELLSTYTPSDNGSGGTITAEQQRQQSMPTYREVGVHGGNKIIFTYGPPDMGQELNIFEQSPDGKVVLIAEPQTTGTYVTDYQTEAVYLKGAKDQTTAKVSSIDSTTKYDSLSVPSKITLDNGEVVTGPQYVGISSGIYNPTSSSSSGIKVRELGSSALYRTEQTYADTKLTNIGYELITPLGTTIGMGYAPNTVSLEKYTFTNGRVATIKDNGKTVADTIAAIARGCGGTSAAVTRSEALTDKELEAIGKTDTGRIVYQPIDKNSALYKKAYDEYAEMQKGQNLTAVTKDEFVAEHGLMIIKNTAGERLVYSRSAYALQGGCAKPVVYLYPSQAMSVSVSIGANVKVSDPLYGAHGWQGVWAEPNGQLTYSGKKYTSLFWEGQGIGKYPSITSGTVVKRADAAKTMRAQLAEQGLNSKESADFMAFWESKIPAKPYIRLTWLSTAQMNTLAPLNVWPRPTTTLRVFLDMDGYNTPIKLPAQKLTTTERHGFTVVEWGGLTIEGLR